MVRSHQTFRLSNGNRIAIATTTTTYTKAKRQRAKPIPFVLYEILTIRPSLKSRPAVGMIWPPTKNRTAVSIGQSAE
jgi:hypothetical protein